MSIPKRGRPRMGNEKRRTVCLSVSKQIVKFLNTQPNKSQCVEAMIKNTKAFKAFIDSQADNNQPRAGH